MIDVTSRFRRPQAERGFGLRAARARQNGLQNEAFLARARARRATQDPFTPRAPFKGNLANQTCFFETVAAKI